MVHTLRASKLKQTKERETSTCGSECEAFYSRGKRALSPLKGSPPLPPLPCLQHPGHTTLSLQEASLGRPSETSTTHNKDGGPPKPRKAIWPPLLSACFLRPSLSSNGCQRYRGRGRGRPLSFLKRSASPGAVCREAPAALQGDIAVPVRVAALVPRCGSLFLVRRPELMSEEGEKEAWCVHRGDGGQRDVTCFFQQRVSCTVCIGLEVCVLVCA